MDGMIQRLAALLPKTRPQSSILIGALLLILFAPSAAAFRQSGGINTSHANTPAQHDAELPAESLTTQIDEAATTEQQQEQQQTVDRLTQILKAHPHFGTAFDRLYEYYATQNQLDNVVQELHNAVTADPSDDTSALLAGMFDLHRGQQKTAIKSLQIAEQKRPDDAVATWYLARANALDGQLEKAAELLERAILKQPVRSDLMEISVELGRIYGRLRRPEDALEVWNKLEQTFPNNRRVAEQIAETLLQSGQLQEALRRYDLLANQSTDAYQRTQFAIAAATVSHKLGHQADAVNRLEQIQNTLRPDSWLYSDVRSRIEGILKPGGDASIIAEYYKARLHSHPEDMDAVVRLSGALEQLGHTAEAEQLLTDAQLRSPRNNSIRAALIELLIRCDKIPDALQLHEKWNQIEPENPDQLEAWGLLVRRAPSLSENERLESARLIWNRMLATAPTDPAVYARVASLLLDAGMKQDALVEFRRAIELAPQDPHYREQLGQAFWKQDQPEEAVAAWKSIATDDRNTPDNLLHLAEILHRYNQLPEAISAMKEACKSNPDFVQLLTLSGLLIEAKDFDDAALQLDRIDQLAHSPQQKNRLLRQRILLLQESGQLEPRIQQLKDELTETRNATSDRWQQLAMCQEATGNTSDAATSIDKALAIDGGSLELWTIAASLHEACLHFDAAILARRRLMRLDYRNSFEYLTRIITLHERARRTRFYGDTIPQPTPDSSDTSGKNTQSANQNSILHQQAAIAAIDELLQLFPDRIEAWQFAAEMQLRLGTTEAGLETLQKAALRFPENRNLQIVRGYALTNFGSVAEAKALWWNLFDQSIDADQRSQAIPPLALLSARTNETESLITQLYSRASNAEQRREMQLHAAAVWMETGNITMARQTLQTLLTENSNDAALLRRLSQLCEREGNLQLAIHYQRRLNELIPSAAGKNRLSGMLLELGSQFEREGNGATACQTYAQALIDDPARFAADFETHLQSFETARQLPLLAQTLLKVDLAEFSDNAMLLAWLIVELHRSATDAPLADKLTIRILKQFPGQNDQIRQLLGSHGVKQP